MTETPVSGIVRGCAYPPVAEALMRMSIFVTGPMAYRSQSRVALEEMGEAESSQSRAGPRPGGVGRPARGPDFECSPSRVNRPKDPVSSPRETAVLIRCCGTRSPRRRAVRSTDIVYPGGPRQAIGPEPKREPKRAATNV